MGTAVQGAVKFTLRAIPLPTEIIEFLQANISIIKKLGELSGSQDLHRHQQLASSVGETIGSETTAREAEEVGEDDSYEPANALSGEVERKPTVKLPDFWQALAKLLDAAGQDWRDTADKIWSFGPYHYGPNILLDRRSGATNSCVFFSAILLR